MHFDRCDSCGGHGYYGMYNSSTGPYANRVTLDGNNLKFSSMTRKDNGRYDCEVSGNQMFGEANVQVTVLGTHPFTNCSSFQFQTF